MAEPSSPQQPDEWQALAAQHRQEQFAVKVARLDKQARRGNRMIGGCLMVFGVLALFGGLFVGGLLLARPSKITTADVRAICASLAGGALTVFLGWAIWRHRRPELPHGPVTDRVDATLRVVDVIDKLGG